MKIAILGTQGIPNKYGGFEQLVEYLVQNNDKQIQYIVFCSSKNYETKIDNYNGAKLVYLPFSANGLSSIVYDILSIIISLKYDKILLLGSSGALILPFLGGLKKKIILNIGGLDWQRSKWTLFVQKILKSFEKTAILNSGKLVSDNLGIKNYILNEYGRESVLIEYGGDHIQNISIEHNDLTKYPFLNGKYALAVARIQPDNNVEMIIEAFVTLKNINLVLIGNWKNSTFGIELKSKYINYSNILLIDAIYDNRVIDLIRSNCYLYIHGHSAGGTNPSLVEAMSFPLTIISYASIYNKFTTENKALYFNNSIELSNIVQNIELYNLDNIKNDLKEIAYRRYKWSIISEKYKELFNE